MFASLEQANHIWQLVMRYYNSVLATIDNDDFAPLFYTLAQWRYSMIISESSVKPKRRSG